MREFKRFLGYVVLSWLGMGAIFLIGVILKVALVMFLKGWNIL